MPKIITLFCPSCGANLDYNIDKPHRFCQYCGSEIKIGDDYTSSHTYRKIDESRIKEAETIERIRMKELELKEQELLQKEKTRKLRIKSTIILAPIGIVLLSIGTLLLENSNGSFDLLSEIFILLGMLSIVSIIIMWAVAQDKK